jgi:hypothetical protein
MVELFEFIECRVKFEYFDIAELGQAIKLEYCFRTEQGIDFKFCF